jgi:predicted AlkP superfamily phosphohydrolase/phosphomutase
MDGLDLELAERSGLVEALEEGGLDCRVFESVVPPVTVPAWACGFSGLEPDSVGAFDFQSLDLEERDFSPVSPEKMAGYGYWNHTRKTSALFDVPSAGQPELDGCAVGGAFQLGELETQPEDLAEEIESAVDEEPPRDMEHMGSEAERRKEIRRIFRFRTQVLEWLVENRDEDIYFPVFRIPDTTMHHTDSEGDMMEAYGLVEDFLRDFLEERVGEDDDVIVVSDHGSVRFEREFHANAWLEENGFLETGSNSVSWLDSLVFRVADLGRRLGIRDLLVRLNELAKSGAGKDFSPGGSNVIDGLLWEETEAFAYVTGVCAYGGIWINDGRLEGVVDDVDGKKSEIARRLESREEVVWVRDSTEVYEDSPEIFPDLVVRLDERTKFESSPHPKVLSEVSGFMHRKQGFVASNRELRDDSELVDLAPTILHLLGDTVPEHMDGKSMLKGGVEKESKETSGIDF